MQRANETTEAAESYAEAHRTHYVDKELPRALELYNAIIAAYPDSEEAGYARSQVKNLVNTVVPRRDLFDAHVTLLSEHLAQRSLPDSALAPSTP